MKRGSGELCAWLCRVCLPSPGFCLGNEILLELWCLQALVRVHRAPVHLPPSCLSHPMFQPNQTSCLPLMSTPLFTPHLSSSPEGPSSSPPATVVLLFACLPSTEPSPVTLEEWLVASPVHPSTAQGREAGRCDHYRGSLPGPCKAPYRRISSAPSQVGNFQESEFAMRTPGLR